MILEIAISLILSVISSHTKMLFIQSIMNITAQVYARGITVVGPRLRSNTCPSSVIPTTTKFCMMITRTATFRDSCVHRCILHYNTMASLADRNVLDLRRHNLKAIVPKIIQLMSILSELLLKHRIGFIILCYFSRLCLFF